MKLVEAKKLYLKAKKAYYNSQPIMTDKEFDKLEDAIRKAAPDWKELSKTGAPVANKKREVPLESYMPSLNKAYPEAIDKWLAKHNGPFIVMDKLDGSSLLATYDGKTGKLISLVTRGDGTLGQDITFLVPYLNLPKPKPSSQKKIMLRLEAVMKRKTFDKKWSKEFDNPRNMVNGLLNRRNPHPALADIDLVVLGRIGMTLVEGLDRHGPDAVFFKQKSASSLTAKSLGRMLESRREFSHYEMDGLVIVPANQVVEYKSADKPKWAVAFKENVSVENAPTAVVKRIVYQVSRHGRIIPKVEIEPIKMNGVVVTYATAHNAKWMMDRGIGPGAQIKIVRSGDVIPKIVDVVKKGKHQPPKEEWEWDGVHMVLANKEGNEDVDCKRILTFFQQLGIEHIALKNIRKLYTSKHRNFQSPAGYIEEAGSLGDDLSIILNEEGLGKAIAKKVADQLLAKINNMSIKELMLASGCYDAGIGSRRLDQVAQHVSLLKFSKFDSAKVLATLSSIKGMGAATIKLFQEGNRRFQEWEASIGFYLNVKDYAPKKAKVVKGGKYSGMVCAWTGYRNKEQEQIIIDGGGIVDKLSKKTTHLFYNPQGKFMAKVDKAKADGIKTLVWEKWYNN